MKKFLILLILLCLISVPVFAGTEITASDVVFSVNGVVAEKAQPGYVSLEAEFKNAGIGDMDVTAVIAGYIVKNGVAKINGVGIESGTVPAGKSLKFAPGVKVDSETSFVRYFAYSSSTLQPIISLRYEFENTGSPVVDEPVSMPVVCDWADNKKAAVSITIDDGDYTSAVKYNELLTTYDVYSTQFFKADKVTKIDGWKAIFADGHMDVGNHSANHSSSFWNALASASDEDIAYEISTARETLLSTFPGYDVLSYAVPWGKTSDKVFAELKKNHYANRNAGGGVLKSKTPSDFFSIPACVVKYGTTTETLNGNIDTAVSNGGWCVELLHGIGADGSADSAYSSKYSTIEDHFKYIKQKSEAGDVWSGSFNDVVKYIYERNSAVAKVLWSDNLSVGIKVTDGMADDELFDYPLTYKVNLPASWSGSAEVKQGDKTETSEIVSEGGKKYAYVKIIPDGGIAVINNK